jgi:RecA/RadA recombinase
VSASAALDELASDVISNIPTGLAGLDRVLVAHSPAGILGDDSPGGIARGQVTEFWGPPGVGKTALG